MTSPEAGLAAFAAALSPAGLPAPVVAAARRSIADALGCMVGAWGRDAAPLRAAAPLARAAPGPAAVPGRAWTAAPAAAAWLNGLAAHALDYDDYTLSSWIGHPTVAVLPAVLAALALPRPAAASGGGSRPAGAELVAAYVAGVEVGARLGLAAGRAAYDRGWHNTSLLGAPAAAAAASRLLGLDAAATAHAMAAAASQAAGLRVSFGTMTKPLHAGHAARAGVEAAWLAASGWTGAAAALSGEGGLLPLATGLPAGEVAATLRAANGDLGERWDLADPGLGLKPYPACAYTHWAIDAALALREGGSAGVAAIELVCDPLVPRVCTHRWPATGRQGQFSVPYAVAVALLDGAAGLDQFADARLAGPDRAELERLVAAAEFTATDAFAAVPWGGELVLERPDGSRRSLRVAAARGTPERPLDEAAVAAKVAECAAGMLAPDAVERALAGLWRLERLSEQQLADLMEEFRVSAGSGESS